MINFVIKLQKYIAFIARNNYLTYNADTALV